MAGLVFVIVTRLAWFPGSAGINPVKQIRQWDKNYPRRGLTIKYKQRVKSGCPRRLHEQHGDQLRTFATPIFILQVCFFDIEATARFINPSEVSLIDANFVGTSGTAGCHHNNLQCHQWRLSWYYDFRFSVYAYCLNYSYPFLLRWVREYMYFISLSSSNH